jgi:hypothetical protein
VDERKTNAVIDTLVKNGHVSSSYWYVPLAKAVTHEAIMRHLRIPKTKNNHLISLTMDMLPYS